MPGLAYPGRKKNAGNNTALLPALSICLVFLCLAALYESWLLPVAVILVAPLGAFGALSAAWLCGVDMDIYFQLGLLTIIGLASRNAIFMVEFAKDGINAGMPVRQAVFESVRMRLRPILITSMAFLGGILPQAMSGGANSGAQSSLGITLAGGIIMATVCPIYFTPLFLTFLMEGKFRV